MKKSAIRIRLVVVALLAASTIYVVHRQMADRRLARSVIGRWETGNVTEGGMRRVVGTWRFNRDGTGVLETEVLSAPGESVDRFLEKVLWKVRRGELHMTAPGKGTQVFAIRCTPDTLDLHVELAAGVEGSPVLNRVLTGITFERIVQQAEDT